VTRLATLVAEAAFVGIGVTVVTFSEGKSLVARRAAGVGSMTLFALHLLVQASQRVTRLVVIEFAGSILPSDEIVTL